MTIPLLQVDAFTICQYAGNPAGVCIPLKSEPAEWMQAVASEMNVAETAFLVARGGGHFDLRWFTPTVEVPLCGHATLAAAHAIWERGIEPRGLELVFDTASGPLRAKWLGEGWIELDFPSIPLEAVAAGSALWPRVEGLADALGVKLVDAAASGSYWVLLAESAAAVRDCRPDFTALAALGDMVIVTAPSDGVLPATANLPPGVASADFVSRVFVPAWGIPEDPVTGSAHCALGPFWASRLGRDSLVGFQASARGGVVAVRLEGERVHLGGQAVTVFEAQLRV